MRSKYCNILLLSLTFFLLVVTVVVVVVVTAHVMSVQTSQLVPSSGSSKNESSELVVTNLIINK